MIHEIWSDRPTFKRLKFRQGLNIVVANRGSKATQGDKRNAVGKSSLIDIIHFLLGAQRDAASPLAATELREDVFKMSFDMFGEPTIAVRANGERDRITIEGAFDSWPVKPDVDPKTHEVSVALTHWFDLLGRSLLGLPSVTQIEPGSHLSFRSCISYFARRERDQGFADWRRHFSKQQAVDWQVSLAYLLGLDTKSPVQLHKVKEREATRKKLGKALREGLLGLAIPRPSALRARHGKVKRQVERLSDQLKNYHVLEFYSEMEREADDLQRQIDDLTNANVVDRGLLGDISEAIKTEAPPALPEVERLYKEAGVVLPGVSLARYEDVRKFHDAIVANRKEHLSAERHDIERRIKEREKKRFALVGRRQELMDALSSGGALSHFRKLEQDLSRRNAELEALTQQLSQADELKALQANLKVERANAELRMQTDLAERSEIVEGIAEVFEEISSQLYDDPAELVVSAGPNGLEIDIIHPDIVSGGVMGAQIVTFDLMLAKWCAEHGRFPGFLIHDSHAFDGVDGRQAASALLYGHKLMTSIKSQYIVTLNSDELEKIEREGQCSLEQYVLSPQLDDSETGGLFGFRFASPRPRVETDEAD